MGHLARTGAPGACIPSQPTVGIGEFDCSRNIIHQECSNGLAKTHALAILARALGLDIVQIRPEPDGVVRSGNRLEGLAQGN